MLFVKDIKLSLNTKNNKIQAKLFPHTLARHIFENHSNRDMVTFLYRFIIIIVINVET